MSSNSTLHKLQSTELTILKEFKRICEKYGFRYFLCAGTLLGAVRHQGFIPWDDDVDVSMPYDDYIRFLEIGQKELGSKYFLQTSETEKYYDAPFAKIRLTNSTFLDSKFAKRHINHGIWIDIFPMVYTSDAIIDKQRKKLKLCKAIQMDDLIASNPRELIKEYGEKTIRILRAFHKIFPFKVRKKISHKILKKTCDHYPTEQYFEVAGSTGITCPCILFKDSMQLAFEDDYFSVPKMYKEYLEMRYGDYMQLPPEDQRVGVHADIIDFDYSYSVLVNRKERSNELKK